eukprot:CAMPEP_0175003030 /NCGR_PEP_ID=MMETSP0005-20121125/4008_1 /TAXON_ID=420556 /ORGANISM="Ochromonas sp., Strain CCMP1393" /LENGTH=40 /DNA_ID= /DNA_START= /DNA_END= /DNA_ORIENTATION=
MGLRIPPPPPPLRGGGGGNPKADRFNEFATMGSSASSHAK